MKKIKYISIYIVALFVYFSASELMSQQDSIYKFIIPELKIYQSENTQDVVYGFNEFPNYFYVIGDSIKVDPSKYKYSVSINDLNRISLTRANSFWGGAAIGSVFGFLTGFFIGVSFNNLRADILGGIAGGLMLSLPVAGLFGTVGLGVLHDTEFDLSGYPTEQKKALLIKIMQDNKVKKEE